MRLFTISSSEFVPKGNLYQLINDAVINLLMEQTTTIINFINSQSRPLTPRFAFRVAVDVAKAMRFLHTQVSYYMIIVEVIELLTLS